MCVSPEWIFVERCTALISTIYHFETNTREAAKKRKKKHQRPIEWLWDEYCSPRCALSLSIASKRARLYATILLIPSVYLKTIFSFFSPLAGWRICVAFFRFTAAALLLLYMWFLSFFGLCVSLSLRFTWAADTLLVLDLSQFYQSVVSNRAACQHNIYTHVYICLYLHNLLCTTTLWKKLLVRVLDIHDKSAEKVTTKDKNKKSISACAQNCFCLWFFRFCFRCQFRRPKEAFFPPVRKVFLIKSVAAMIFKGKFKRKMWFSVWLWHCVLRSGWKTILFTV